MKLSIAVRLLRLLPSSPEHALTVQEIQQRWPGSGSPKAVQRSIERYTRELSEDQGSGMPLLGVVRDSTANRYYVLTSQVANWFMTEEIALDLQLSRDILGQALAGRSRTGIAKLADMAEQFAKASPEVRRIRERLKVVPDGIGRLPARVDNEVLRTAVDAIGKNRKVRLSYTKANGSSKNELVSPLGLVAKDGTIYLVAVNGLADSPRHYALHRISEADLHFQQAQARPEFDLQQHILETHQFSHKLDANAPNVVLRLRVAPETIYHFRERPLSVDQKEVSPKGSEPWYVVTATVPRTILLMPFLMSMGPYIEVVGPEDIRREAAEWTSGMYSHYATNSSGS